MTIANNPAEMRPTVLHLIEIGCYAVELNGEYLATFKCPPGTSAFQRVKAEAFAQGYSAAMEANTKAIAAVQSSARREASAWGSERAALKSTLRSQDDTIARLRKLVEDRT